MSEAVKRRHEMMDQLRDHVVAELKQDELFKNADLNSQKAVIGESLARCGLEMGFSATVPFDVLHVREVAIRVMGLLLTLAETDAQRNLLLYTVSAQAMDVYHERVEMDAVLDAEWATFN